MIKFLIFLVLAYLAYRLFAGPPLLDTKKTKHIREQEPDEDGFADYEEVE